MRTKFVPVKASVADLVGHEYCDAVRRGADVFQLGFLAEHLNERVEFFPESMYARLVAMLSEVGTVVARGLAVSAGGAGTDKFVAATKTGQAPLTGFGFFRVGEDGRLYLATKSEHYHIPLGHRFPGFTLIDRARAGGVLQATHNNTRGHITRALESELIRSANGLDSAGALPPAETRTPGVLNRVLNLETGSLAGEAALKLLLARFHQIQTDGPAPKYAGKVPVLVVMADVGGGSGANYHGTTMLAQVARGMWPEMRSGLDGSGVVRVRAVRPNNLSDLEAVFADVATSPDARVAGFLHEIVLMNYGARLLTPEFLRAAYVLCEEHDVPVLADEIQCGVWARRLFLHLDYGLKPSMVAVGKGFPGGEYCASKLIFSGDLDVLPQFGALVTNGQEELASLAYLITMRWARENGDVTAKVGEYFQERLRDFAAKRRGTVSEVHGWGHLAGLHFTDMEKAKAFAAGCVDRGLDVSVQAYKSEVPPAALMKLPLIAGCEVVDTVVETLAGVAN